MNVRTKALVTVLLAGTVITVFTLQTKNSNLFKGLLTTENPEVTTESTTPTTNDSALLPDLAAEVAATMPVNPAGDITANVTIKNNGPGMIDGKKAFKYTLFINGTEVMSNTDSYTTMEAGDSFSFNYPISREIYAYKNTGKLKFIVDSENSIKETSEDNNMMEIEY